WRLVEEDAEELEWPVAGVVDVIDAGRDDRRFPGAVFLGGAAFTALEHQLPLGDGADDGAGQAAPPVLASGSNRVNPLHECATRRDRHGGALLELGSGVVLELEVAGRGRGEGDGHGESAGEDDDGGDDWSPAHGVPPNYQMQCCDL